MYRSIAEAAASLLSSAAVSIVIERAPKASLGRRLDRAAVYLRRIHGGGAQVIDKRERVGGSSRKLAE